jgi:pimeloyl-ACP methyl ester carboxylesterase
MGGVLAVLLAERHSRHVRRVIDVDGNVSLEDCVFSGQAAAMSLEQFCAGGFGDMRDQIYRQGVDDEALRGYYTSLRLCDPRAYHLSSAELIAESRPEDLAARLARLPVPVLYVAGSPRGASARSRELLARSHVPTVEISPSGHWPFIDQEAAFVASVRRFLDEPA